MNFVYFLRNHTKHKKERKLFKTDMWNKRYFKNSIQWKAESVFELSLVRSFNWRFYKFKNTDKGFFARYWMLTLTDNQNVDSTADSTKLGTWDISKVQEE